MDVTLVNSWESHIDLDMEILHCVACVYVFEHV